MEVDEGLWVSAAEGVGRVDDDRARVVYADDMGTDDACVEA